MQIILRIIFGAARAVSAATGMLRGTPKWGSRWSFYHTVASDFIADVDVNVISEGKFGLAS